MVKITRNMFPIFYPGFIPIYGDMVSGVSPAAGLKSGQSNQKINFGFMELIKKRISNHEYRRNVFYLFYKKIERSDSTLRHSAVRYSIFCGSLFPGSAVRCLAS